MQFLSSWATQDKKTLLNFSQSVMNTFFQHIQAKNTDLEAGGLLLGSVHGTHMLIKEATVPTDQDNQLLHLFERMPHGHNKIAAERWKTSKGKTRYLGEWHTHPEDHPTPSALDRKEWNQLAEKRLDGRPLLTVIIGRKSIHVELITRSNKKQLLFPFD